MRLPSGETLFVEDIMPSIDDFDDMPTVEIPRETMSDLVFGVAPSNLTGEGHDPAGPSRPTRDLRVPGQGVVDDEVTVNEDISDGIPLPVGGLDDTLAA
jgi:hypothetical protein